MNRDKLKKLVDDVNDGTISNRELIDGFLEFIRNMSDDIGIDVYVVAYRDGNLVLTLNSDNDVLHSIHAVVKDHITGISSISENEVYPGIKNCTGKLN